MQILPQSVLKLIEELQKLPSIGPRTAERLTFHLLRSGPHQSNELGSAAMQLHQNIQYCTICHNLAEANTCAICASPRRNHRSIAVVEEPLDVIALEKTAQYTGVYHVLGGVISPIDGIGPEQLSIPQLLGRARAGVDEIILATNPSTEGEATAMYIKRQLEPLGVKLTRLARGLPVGGDLEYADQITLGRALQGRQVF